MTSNTKPNEAETKMSIIERLLDEKPENLVSDLKIDSNGQLVPNSTCDETGDDDDDDDDEDDDIKVSSMNQEEDVIFSGCRTLMKLMEVPQSDNDDLIDSTDDDDEDVDVDEENKESDNNNDLEQGENGKDNGKDGEEIKAPSSPDDATSVEDLCFVNNMYDAVLRAVNEVVRMRCSKDAKIRQNSFRDDKKDPQKKTRSGRSRRGGKKSSISEQKQAGVDSMSDAMNNASLVDKADDSTLTSTSIGKEEIDKNGEEWTQIKSTSVDSNQSSMEELPKSASYKTQITFNTFSILIPVVCKMLNHPERTNYNLKMKGPRIRKKEYSGNNNKRVKIPENIMDVGNDKPIKKSQGYLFFDKVYSITTIRAIEQLRREVDRLLHCFPGDIKSMQPHLLWGTCKSSQEIITKTFIFETSDNREDKSIEKFSKSIDEKIIQPLTDRNTQTTSMQEAIIYRLNSELTSVLSSRFRGVNLTVYGSCLSGLSLGGSSDVDISLYIPDIWQLKQDYSTGKHVLKHYEKTMKKFVYRVRDTVADRGQGQFIQVTAVPFARVPVVKGTCRFEDNHPCPDTYINFDICFLNDIAVANSKLLREYTKLDQRVRMLMLSVKSWIKWKGIGNAAENTLSSYTWMIMVIFYLQCIGFVPVLQCPRFMAQHQEEHDPTKRWHTVNNLKTHFLTCARVQEVGIWKLPDHFSETSVSTLLAGFFNFYARVFPRHTTAISIRLGQCVLQKSVFKSAKLWRICIEDPFETHDSHCPHDLGTPMHEDGQAKVSKALNDAADQMEEMFSECSDVQDCIGSFIHLDQLDSQPNHVPKSTGRNPKHNRPNRQNNKRSQNRNQGRGNRHNGGFERSQVKRKEPKVPIGKHSMPETRHDKPKRKEPKAPIGKGSLPGSELKRSGKQESNKKDETQPPNEMISDKHSKNESDGKEKKKKHRRGRNREQKVENKSNNS